MSGRLVLSYSALRSASCWTRTPFSSVYGAGDDPVTGWPDWGRVQTEMTSIFVSGISKAEDEFTYLSLRPKETRHGK